LTGPPKARSDNTRLPPFANRSTVRTHLDTFEVLTRRDDPPDAAKSRSEPQTALALLPRLQRIQSLVAIEPRSTGQYLLVHRVVRSWTASSSFLALPSPWRLFALRPLSSCWRRSSWEPVVVRPSSQKPESVRVGLELHTSRAPLIANAESLGISQRRDIRQSSCNSMLDVLILGSLKLLPRWARQPIRSCCPSTLHFLGCSSMTIAHGAYSTF